MSQSATEPAAPSGIVAALRKYADLLAFLLLGYLVLQYLVTLGHLFGGKSLLGTESKFADRAFEIDISFLSGSFLSIVVLGVVAAAVAMATVVGERSKLARPVIIAALGVVAAGAVLGFITLVVGLFADGTTFGGRLKTETALTLLVLLALYVVAALVLLGMLSSPELRPVAKPQPAYGQYQGAPQGYGGYQQQAQPPYGYQPQGQYDSQPPYQQQAYEQQAYDQPTQQGAPSYEQSPQQPQQSPAYEQPSYEQPPQQPQQSPAYESPPPIWEQPAAPPPPSAQQPSGWPPPQAPQQQPPSQQRWPEGNQ
ncbi:MAG: hypothetical protein DLM59_07705 [Pseudonocardiales bacterium]|nr:MAG: hypothetical protein DLM59_07705 [Pseudonocardiales bacterium]